VEAAPQDDKNHFPVPPPPPTPNHQGWLLRQGEAGVPQPVGTWPA
jgi:hypothetical protein